MSGKQLATPKTLSGAHAQMAKERPKADAPLVDWLRFYRRSAAVYAEVAEIDRGHHHEAMYWATRERERANDVQDRIDRSKRALAARQGAAVIPAESATVSE